MNGYTGFNHRGLGLETGPSGTWVLWPVYGALWPVSGPRHRGSGLEIGHSGTWVLWSDGEGWCKDDKRRGF